MPNWTREQSQAIYQKGKNIIVSAGAGSGKTAVLTERVITHLKQNVHIDNLLILTFTNAAAAEMKDRIRAEIKKYPTLKEELDKIDTSFITTFDAYALSLVKKYSHILNIPKDICIIDPALMSLKKRQFLEEIFEESYKDNQKFIKLIDDFCTRDDEEILENILSLYDKFTNVYDHQSYLKNYIKNYYNSKNIKRYVEEYEKYLNNLVKQIELLLKKISLYDIEEYTEKIYELLNPMINANNYKEIKQSIVSKLPNLPKNSEEEIKNAKKTLTEKLKELEKLTKYENEEEICDTLYKGKKYVEVIIELLLKVDKKIENYKQSINSYEFIDISNLAINLLKNSKEIRNSLKDNFYEILIDKYQDTNDLQELFVSLIEKNNVYMVGDIKQSIYRFRNTNPKLFKDKYSLYSKGEKGIKIDLNKNFRSRNEVLSGINKIFDVIMDENIGGAEYRLSHRMIFGNTNYNKVNSENYSLEILKYKDLEEYTKEEIEIFTIASDIKEKVKNKYQIMLKTGNPKPISYSDFAILLDRSSSFDKYKQIFEYLGIPLAVYKDKTITDSEDIIIIKNIYKLIISIYDKNYSDEYKYAYVSVSRSFLLEVDDDIIFRHLNDFFDTKLYLKCKKLSENILELSNKELIENIIDEFNFYEKIIKKGDISEHITVIDSLIKIAQNLDNIGYSPFDFYEYLKEVLKHTLKISQKINKGSMDAVKIMTIHASKGLEYPVCYFAGLSKKFNLADLKQKFYFSEKYGIISPYMDNNLNTSFLKTLLKQDYLKEEISEKLRLFYVALTRAREKIIIVTDLDEMQTEKTRLIDDEVRLKYLSFKDIIDSCAFTLEDNIKEIDTAKINLTKNYNLTKKKFNKEKFLTGKKLNIEKVNIKTREIENKTFSKNIHILKAEKENKNIELGLKMHELFETFDFKKQNKDNLSPFEIKKIDAFINKGLLNDNINIYKEYEFIYEDSQSEYHGIIDLLIEKENENIIVDYKLKNVEDLEYIKQLQGYKKYIENITDKPTKIYLYSILDETLKNISDY